jgi:hypothetical protein
VKKTSLLSIIMLCLIVAGCNPEKKAIKDVAYKYSVAMANYKVDDAESYATSETRNTTLIVARRMMKKVGDAYIAADTPATIKILTVDQTSDTTAYAVYHKETPSGKNFSDTLQLRKRNGTWQAHALIPQVKADNSGVKQFHIPEGENNQAE